MSEQKPIGEAFDEGNSIVIAMPGVGFGWPEMPDDHNCDAMGCGQWHVIYRFPKQAERAEGGLHKISKMAAADDNTPIFSKADVEAMVEMAVAARMRVYDERTVEGLLTEGLAVAYEPVAMVNEHGQTTPRHAWWKRATEFLAALKERTK